MAINREEKVWFVCKITMLIYVVHSKHDRKLSCVTLHCFYQHNIIHNRSKQYENVYFEATMHTMMCT